MALGLHRIIPMFGGLENHSSNQTTELPGFSPQFHGAKLHRLFPQFALKPFSISVVPFLKFL